MTERLKLREKRNRDGDVIRDCWETEDRYTIAKCRLPETRYTVTRSTDAAPFAYVNTHDEVVGIIQADRKASALLAAEAPAA